MWPQGQLSTLWRRQHIQDHSKATAVELHWGYPDRVVPCTNDVGSCQYLDGVYWMHDISILYSCIMWAVIGGILILFVLFRIAEPKAASGKQRGERNETPLGPQRALYRGWRALCAMSRRYLLPESLPVIFGHVTRLQITILGVILGYLLIFS